MKRFVALCACLMLLLSGCGAVEQPETPAAEQLDEERIYTTFFPLYLLAERVLRDVPGMWLGNVVQPQDGCLRSYELSEWDIAKIASADAVIIGGRGLESFEGGFQSTDSGVAVISAMDGLELIGQSEVVNDEEAGHADGPNPWLFLSVNGAKEIMESMAGGMAALDPGLEEIYANNLAHGEEALDALIGDMMESLVGVDPVPVALMHEGLPYLAEDLGLDVVCRIDREPGTELYDNDMQEALGKLSASGAKVVLLERQAPDQLKSGLRDAGYEVALIDTLTTYPLDARFEHYLGAMQKNADSIAAAFAAVARQHG